jgi:glycosyltransferase involved in cell wall biosynthesis
VKILILAPYPIDQAPSQRFRFEHYLPLFAANDHQYEFHGFLDKKAWDILYIKGKIVQKFVSVFKGYLKRILLLFRLASFDIVFIHREAAPLGPPIFEWIIAKVFRKRVIYDFDDAIWLPNTTAENKIAGLLKWHSKIASICQWAYKITPGNEYLATFARQSNLNVTLLPTVVNTNTHAPTPNKNTKEKVTIGWTGSHSTLVYLNPLVEILQKLEQHYSFYFIVIADKNPELPLANFKYIKWSKESEIVDLQLINIGIMPLADDQWAKGKCGFKAIQYLALGIPAVASPVGVNSQIVIDGDNGFLCDSADQWYTALEKLLQNQQLRKEFGAKGRQHITDNYSVQSQEQAFFSLFNNK